MGKRKVWPLNFDWRFKADDDPAYSAEAFDDTHWEQVDIPHANRTLPLHYFDDNACCFTSWYRKSLTLPSDSAGRRMFLRFEGVSTTATVYANGVEVSKHRGGYTPFEVELTAFAAAGRTVQLAVRVDSTEDCSIPPFGGVIDYLTYGGIYRSVALRSVSASHIADVFVRTPEPLKEVRRLEATVQLDLADSYTRTVRAEVVDSSHAVVATIGPLMAAPLLQLQAEVGSARLWDIDDPALYTLRVALIEDGKEIDVLSTRFGFRQAKFTQNGFFLNGRRLKLRGLNRHQSYPYVGYAMPASQQREDALMLKHKLGVQIVRTSHYPQSPAFLDCCDEIGLLVFTEIPGWQHIGSGKLWRETTLQHVREMVLRDRNHPSIVLWGVRINESPDDDALYTDTNALARALDPTRQTGGVRNFKGSHLLEDVYTYNDFVHHGDNHALDDPDTVCKNPKVPYLVTEHNGHMFPTKRFDTEEIRLEHALRHARVLDAMYAKERCCGAIGWCMSDYNTHREFGSGDLVCYHGVTDMFRIPKLAAAVYASQQREYPFMEVSTQMAIGEHPAHDIGDVYVFTNCDSVELQYNGTTVGIFLPDRKRFAHLPHPPVVIDDLIGERLEAEVGFSTRDKKLLKQVLLSASRHGMDLPLRDKLAMGYLLLKHHLSLADGVRLYERYVGSWDGAGRVWSFLGRTDGGVVCSATFSSADSPSLRLECDRTVLTESDTYDVTKLVVSARGELGQLLQFSQAPVAVRIEGPVRLIGPELISLSGGAIGIYVRSYGKKGKAKVTVESPELGAKSIGLRVD